MSILKKISYNPVIIRGVRALGLRSALRKAYYVWARPRNGIMSVKLGELTASSMFGRLNSCASSARRPRVIGGLRSSGFSTINSARETWFTTSGATLGFAAYSRPERSVGQDRCWPLNRLPRRWPTSMTI